MPDEQLIKFIFQYRHYRGFLAVFALTVFCFSLGACGYHLRGSYEIPKELKKIYLQGESSTLHQYFDKAMRSSSGQLVGSADQAGVIIHFFDERFQRRVLSLSARGRANDYELYYRVEYELVNKNKTVLLPRQPVEVRREYFNDQEEIIAKDNEESVIRDEMYDQAVRNIITRAQTALEKKSK